MSTRLMIAVLTVPALAGCQQLLRGEKVGSGGEPDSALPPTLARLQKAYADLGSGRFVCLADLNTLPQAGLFRTLGPDGVEVEPQPEVSERHSIDETGAGGLRAHFGGPDDQLCFDSQRSSELALVRDWRKYNLLLFNIYGPPDGVMLEFTVRSGSDTPLSSTRKLFAEPGWQLYRFDLAGIGEEIDLADVRALCWSVPQLSAPLDLYFDDFLLADNTRYLFGEDVGEGELYGISSGRRIVVGARGRFELAFADGVMVEWHAGDRHNLTVRSGLGPWPVPLPEDWSGRRADPVVYDDPNLYANWGARVATTQRIVEQSAFRVVLEGTWQFLPQAGVGVATRDSVLLPEHCWRYVIYPSGQVYLRVAAHARGAGWSGARVGYALALDGRSDFVRVPAAEVYHGETETQFVLFSPPDRERADLLWCPHRRAAAERQLELVSADERRVAVTIGDLEPAASIETAHLLRFWPWDIDAAPEGHSFAADYQHPAIPAVVRGRLVVDAPGDLDRDGFNESEGCYELGLAGGLLRFRFEPGALLRHEPVFRVGGTAGRDCWVYADGRIIECQGRDAAGQLLFALPRVVSTPLTIEVNTRSVAGPS